MRLYILIGIILACIAFLVYKQRQLKIKEKFTTNNPLHGRYIYFMWHFSENYGNYTQINYLDPQSANVTWNWYVKDITFNKKY